MQTDDVAPGLSSVGSANHYAGRHGGKHREAQELFSTQNPTKPSIILRPTSSTYSDLRIRRAEVLPGPSPDNLVPLAPDWWMLSARWNSLSQVCGCNALQLFLTPLWSAGALNQTVLICRDLQSGSSLFNRFQHVLCHILLCTLNISYRPKVQTETPHP